MLTLRCGCLVFALTLVLSGTSSMTFALSAEGANNRQVVEDFRWSGDVSKKARVRIINHFGTITVRSTAQDNIEIVGVIKKLVFYPPILKLTLAITKA